jgi:molecular chaperone GrpE (heat shock protein)
MAKRALLGYDPRSVEQFTEHLRREHALEKARLEREIAQLTEANHRLQAEIDALREELRTPWEEIVARTLKEAYLGQTKLVMEALEDLSQAVKRHEQLTEAEREKREALRDELLRKLQELQTAEAKGHERDEGGDSWMNGWNS